MGIREIALNDYLATERTNKGFHQYHKVEPRQIAVKSWYKDSTHRERKYDEEFVKTSFFYVNKRESQ